MNSNQVWHQFWSGFGWTAYDQSTVPSADFNPDMPRITYETMKSEFDQKLLVGASLWDESYSWERISQKADEIFNYIGWDGKILKYDDGMIWVKRGDTFAQRMPDENDRIRRIYLTVEIEYFTAK